MEELQQFFTQLVFNISNLIPLGYAFGAGMVSAVNPCGFAMLPAYLGLYLGTRELSVAPVGGGPTYGGDGVVVAVPAQMARGVLVTAVVTAGFICLFGGAGAVITAGGRLGFGLFRRLRQGRAGKSDNQANQRETAGPTHRGILTELPAKPQKAPQPCCAVVQLFAIAQGF